MLAKPYATKLLNAVFAADLAETARLGYPKSSGYCRDHIAGYRESENMLWRLDLDLALFVLHQLHQSHPEDYIRLRLKFRDGKTPSRNFLNASIRLFRREFDAAAEFHSGTLKAI